MRGNSLFESKQLHGSTSRPTGLISRIRKHRASLFIAAAPLLMNAAVVWGKATATSIGGLDTDTSNEGIAATGQVYAYTLSTGGGPPLVPVTNALPVGMVNGANSPPVAGGVQTTFFWPFRGFWGPTITVGPNAKANPFSMSISTTSTALPIGLVTPTSTAEAMQTTTSATKVTLSSSADVTVNKEAFGRAVDPITFSGSSSTQFTDVIDSGASLESDDPGDTAGLEYYMFETLSGGTVVPVWSAAIYVTGQLNSLSDLQIVVNSTVGFNNITIQNDIRAAFSLVSNNTTTLMSNVALPSFSLNGGGSSYTILDGIDAEATVPEPGTLALGSSAAVLLLRRRRRHIA
jgi:hypothetical protein